MKGLMKYLAVGLSVLVMAALLVGCAKPPTMEMDAAKVAMDAAVGAGAGTYAKEGLKSINDAWAAAQDEVKKQEGKLFKNYDNAKAMIAKINADAVALKARPSRRRSRPSRRPRPLRPPPPPPSRRRRPCSPRPPRARAPRPTSTP